MQRIVAGLLALAGLLTGAAAFTQPVRDRSDLRVLRSEGIPTTATIVGTQGPGGNTVITTYRTHQGVVYRTTDLSPGGSLTDGRQLRAVYDPRDPTNVSLISGPHSDDNPFGDLLVSIPLAASVSGSSSARSTPPAHPRACRPGTTDRPDTSGCTQPAGAFRVPIAR